MVRKLNILTIFIVSTFLFAFAYFVSNITSQLLFASASSFAFLKQVTFKTILAIVSVTFGIFVFKVPVSEFSLLQNKKRVNSRIYLLIAIILGAIATLCMQVFDFPRVKLLAQLSPIEMIIAVWGFSTVCEEIFCRGLVQNLVMDQRTCYSIAGIIISKPVLIGAAVFGLMHSTIYFSGGSGYTAITIMLFTFFLGLVCGKLKEENGLRSAIFGHLAFNIGGLITGIIIKLILK